MTARAWTDARGQRRRAAIPREARPRAARIKRRIPPALLISLGLHAGVVAAFLLLRAGGPELAEPDKPIAIELVMVEHRGEEKPPVPAARPAPPAVPAPTPPEVAKTEAPTPEPTTAPAAEPPSPQPPAKAPVESRPEEAKETVRPPETSEPAPPRSQPAAEAAARPEPARTPPAAPPAAVPRIDLSGTDSPSDAVAQGERIIPAAANAVFHNRPPEYPEAAAMRGERGVVDVMIHVSPAGTVQSADVVRSSGHALLDRAAREAVLTWRFLPAMKGGRAIQSDMGMRFIFDSQ